MNDENTTLDPTDQAAHAHAGAADHWPTVRLNDVGENVRTAQHLLKAHGANLSVDGEFGPMTERAVNAFKSAHGLPEDGLLGPRAWPQLVIAVEEGSTGHPVRAVQSQLNAHGSQLVVDGEFGPATKQAVEAFQERFRPPLAADGTVGTPTWQHMVATAGNEQAVRDRIVANARWGAAHEPQIHYVQSRPIDGHGHPRKLPLSTDCSGFATDCYEWAGAPDPNGLGYDGQGFTGTMLRACKHIPRAELRPGDLVAFGPGTGEHVVIVVGTGADPQVISHGQERGPFAIALSTESAFHHSPVTFLSAFKRQGGAAPRRQDHVDQTNPPTEDGLPVP